MRFYKFQPIQSSTNINKFLLKRIKNLVLFWLGLFEMIFETRSNNVSEIKFSFFVENINRKDFSYFLPHTKRI